MHSQRPHLQHWLSLRVRLLCAGAFVVSLFLPPYVPESLSAPPEIAQEEESQFLLVEDGFLMKTSSLTDQGTRKAFSQGIIHIVEPKESLSGIAKLYGVSSDTIRNANSLTSDTVNPGQKLLILPVDGVLHTVKRGQNLTTIAELYGVGMEQIADQNKITNGYLLAGQELIIPGGKPIVATPPAKIATAAGSKPQSAAVKAVTVPTQQFLAKATFGELQMPCECFFTQYFNGYHFGVDLQHRGGGPIFAAEAGTVIRADYGWNGGYGNVVEIDHGNGLVTLYGHNKELYVEKGDVVTRGQNISWMGNTGLVHGPTGIHLHFEVHVNGVKKNPTIYLKE